MKRSGLGISLTYLPMTAQFEIANLGKRGYPVDGIKATQCVDVLPTD